MLNRFRGLKPSSKKRSKRRPARHHKLFRPTLEALEPRAMFSGTTIMVNTTADPGDATVTGATVSLRQAIGYADAFGGTSITFAPSLDGQTITLTNGELPITNSMTIAGPGASQLTISGGGNSRIFDVDANDGGVSQVAISGLTITDGNGAGVNAGSFGGAIFNAETLTLTGDTISGNLTSHGGGGIYNEGTLASSFDTISGNSALAGGSGGGIANSGGGVVTSTDDTISGNSATASVGGGIFNQGGSLILSNDTISGNSAGEEGGGIFNGGTLNAASTIVAGNTVGGSPDDIDSGGGFVLNQNNLIGLSFNGQTYTLSQIVATDSSGNPLLANNGGPTQTIALVPGSPAIGAATALATLAAPMASTDTTATVSSTTFLTVGESLEIDSEIVTITAINGDVLSLLRGQDGTTAASHDSGAGLFLAFDQRGALRPDVGSSIGAYQPQNLVVNTTADTGPGDATITGATVSLRQAIGYADAFGGASITFAPSLDGQTITLANGELAITSSMTIAGPGASQLTISGGGNSGIFGVNANDGGASLVAITGLTLSNGNGVSASQDDRLGGAIYNAEALTLSGDTISGNAAQEGGGIYNAGALTLSDDTISGNSAASGGGISNLGTLTSTDDTISGNMAYLAGGIYNQGGPLVSSNDTISGNTASLGIGGGIYNEGGTVTATNDTISGNTAATLGGGVYNYNPVDSSIYIVNLADTIVAGNTAATGPDISGVVESQGGNLIGDASGASGFASADIVGTDAAPLDADLGPLGFYGGPTETIPLLAGSPAIAAAGPLASLATEAGDKNNDSGAINSSDTTATVDSTTFLAVGESLQIDSEIVTITAINGDVLTLLRGQDGTTATKHSDGAGFFLAFDQRGVYRETNDVGAFSAPPLADTTPTLTIDAVEGVSTGQQVLATFTDGNQLATAGDFTANVAWGGSVVGTPTVTVQQTGSSATSSTWEVLGSVIYTQAGTFGVSVTTTETDDGQSVGTANTSFNVAPAALTAGTITGSGGIEGVTAATISATFTDADIYAPAGDFSGTIYWGDGLSTAFTSSAVSGSAGSFTVSGSHQYANGGDYAVVVTVNDGLDGGTAVIGATLGNLVSLGAANAGTYGTLLEDAAGDFFGTTAAGGEYGDGTVFEIPAGTTTVITLASFNGANGARPVAGLIEDASGNLFGTTSIGGASNDGTVFEIPAGTTTITTLASFDDADGWEPAYGDLVEDAGGDLFGVTAYGGSGNNGVVYEVKAGSGMVTPLVVFDGADGSGPVAGLLADSSGDLFGATTAGGANGDGTVFEISAGSYSLTTLVSFNGTDGSNPYGSLIEDASGDLFGTTESGGANGEGTMFEIPAGTTTLTTLASFNGANGALPLDGVIEDAHGDLFGATEAGGASGAGTVYEIPAGSGTIVALASFNPTTSAEIPLGSLLEDSHGNLYGSTVVGGANGDGSVFEVTPFQLSVADAAPIAGTLGGTGGTVGTSSASISATFTDADLSLPSSDFSGTINWGDNDITSFTSSAVSGSDGSFTVSGMHQYAAAGKFSVVVTVNGIDGGSTTIDGQLTVNQATPSISATAGPTVVVGTGAPLIATAVLAGGYDETGDITFTLYGPSGTVVATEMAPVSGPGTYTAPGGYLPTAAGTYQWVASYGDANNSTVSTTKGATPEIAVGTGATLVGNTLYLVGGNSGDQVDITAVGRSDTGSTGIEVQGWLNAANIKSLAYNPAPAALDIVGFNGNDSILMQSSLSIPATVSEGNGNDTIQLGQGNNVIVVGSGFDTITAGNGNNTITAATGSGNVWVNLGNGNNTVTVADTSRGNAFIQAGTGSNSVTVGGGDDQIELGIGSFFAFAGYFGSPIQCGGGTGNNTVVAGSGNDFILLGSGSDAVTAGNGNDVIVLGDGNNTLAAGNGNDIVQGGDGNNVIVVGSGNDVVDVGNGNNVVQAGTGNDTIQAGNGDNLIVGGLGHDTITVGNGDNILIDGSVRLTQAGDTLQAVLDSWIGDIKARDTNAEIAALIAPRLAVTYNTTSANTLIAGNGFDWFWDTYAHDHTDRNATDLLN